MQLFKFFPFCTILFTVTTFAETEYVAFELRGDKVLRVNAVLCNPDNYIGTDAVVGKTITEKIPQLEGMRVNVWQAAQLAGIFFYGLGLRGRDVTRAVSQFAPETVNILTMVFPFDLRDDSNNGVNANSTQMSGFIELVNDSNNHLGAAFLYVRSCFVAKKILAGVEFGYDDVEGYYARPAGGYITITDITSSLGIGLSKIAENVIVDKTAQLFGLEDRGKRMVRTGIKTVYLGASMWAKGQIGWFGSIDSVNSYAGKIEQKPKSDLARLIEEGQVPNTTTPQAPPLPPRNPAKSELQKKIAEDIDVSQEFNVPNPAPVQSTSDASNVQLQSDIPVAPPMPPSLSSATKPTNGVRPKKSPLGSAENAGAHQKETGPTFAGQPIESNKAFAEAAMRKKFGKANGDSDDSDDNSWDEE